MDKTYPKVSLYFYILIRSWKAFEYFNRCVDSVFVQNYQNYKILFVDDASDYTRKQKEYIKKKLAGHVVVFNKTRKFSVYNAYQMIKKYARERNSVVLILDADDWLIDRNALTHISRAYKDNPDILFTYGSCKIFDGKKYSRARSSLTNPFANTRYSAKVIKKVLYRQEPFRISHPMTFKARVFKMIKVKDLKEDNGEWLKYSFDLAIFLPFLEMANGRFKFIDKPLYAYNTGSANINIKKNPFEFIREDLLVRKKKTYGPIS